jgi:glyoxylase-like metal-dependent hydrolase (beta-lactamase superfamily II)
MAKIHIVEGYIGTLYLVEYPDKLLLLDSGCRCDFEVVEAFIVGTLKRPMSDLNLVISTHAHPDHSGGAAELKRRFATKVAGPKGLNEWYSGAKGMPTYLIDVGLTYYVAKRRGRRLKRILARGKVPVDYELSDNSPVPGFEDWIALHTPGHTGVDISLYNQNLSAIYIADIITKPRRSLYRPYPLMYPELYKRTLQKFLELRPKRYLLAHRGEHEIGEEEIKTLIAGIPKVPRNHLRTLPTILKSVVRSLLR